MLIIWHNSHGLRIISSQTVLAVLRKKSGLFIHIIDHRCIDPCICHKQMFSIRRKFNTGSSIWYTFCSIRSSNDLNQFHTFCHTFICFVMIYIDIVISFTENIDTIQFSAETDHTWCAVNMSADNVKQFQFSIFIIHFIYFYMIQTTVYCTEIFLIHGQFYTCYMRNKIMIRIAAANAFMENTICDLPNRSVFIQMHHRHSAVMITADKKITVLIIYIQIAASHTADPRTVHRLQISIRKDFKRLYPFICDRIQKSSVCGHD